MNFDDYFDIQQTAARYGHVLDEFAWERLPDVFTDDVEYDLSAFDRPSLHGIDAIAEAFAGRTIFAHHATNLEITAEHGDRVEAHSKYVAVRAEGVVTGDYRDRWVKTPAGWRIAYRAATIREP